MSQLQNMLNDWVENQLISAEQKDKILLYQEAKKQGKRSKKTLYTFVILGVSIIGIGFISLIAANWETIPASVKLVFDFGLLGGFGFWIYRKHTGKNPILFDALLTLYCLLVLGSIGLVAQIFHTGGEPYMALWFWLAIILPAAFAAYKEFLPYLWTVFFIVSLNVYTFSNHSWWSRYSGESVLAFFVMLPFLLMFIASLYGFIHAIKPLDKLKTFSISFRIFAGIGFLNLIIITDVLLNIMRDRLEKELFIPFAAFAVLSLVFIWLKGQHETREKVILTILTVLTAAAYIPFTLLAENKGYGYYHEPHGGNIALGAGFTIICLFLLSLIFIKRDYRRLFNFVVILIGLRFLIVYFQLIGGLAFTGFGLIFSGLLIIGLAVLWYKNRKKIEDFFTGLVK